MAALTGQTIAATYKGLLKTIGDNVAIPTGSTAKQIVDGQENVTPLYLTNDQIGIGTATPLSILHMKQIPTFGTDTILTIEKNALTDTAQITLKSTTETVYEWYMGMADSSGPGIGDEFFIGSSSQCGVGMIGGVPALWIEPVTANIGLSELNPAGRLHVTSNHSTYTAIFDQDHSTGHGVKIEVDSVSSAQYAMLIENTTDTLFALECDGKLGLGTPYPQHQLQVTGKLTPGELALTTTELTIVADDVLGRIIFGGFDDHAAAPIIFDTGATILAKAAGTWDGETNDLPTTMEFYTTNAGALTGLTRAMAIEGNGSVSISATKTARAELDVDGDIALSGSVSRKITYRDDGDTYDRCSINFEEITSDIVLRQGSGGASAVPVMYLVHDIGGTNTSDLGINQASPDQMVHVTGNRPQMILEDASEANEFLRIGCGDSVNEAVIGMGIGLTELSIGMYIAPNSAVLAKLVRITSAGHVGIGVIPTSFLHVSEGFSGGPIAQIHNTHYDGTPLTTGLSIVAGLVGQNDEYALRCASGATDTFCVTAKGRLGVGTIAPSSNLHIAGTATGTDSFPHNGITIENTHAGSTSEVGIRLSNATTAANYWYAGLNQSSRFQFGYGALFQDSTTELTLFNSAVSSGSVAIGGTVAYNTLSISHSASTGDKGMIIFNENAGISDGNLLGAIGFDGADGGVAVDPLTASAYIAAYAAENHGGSEKGGDLVFGCTAIGEAAGVSSNEYMRIDSEGFVGIGTNLPEYRLDVQEAVPNTYMTRFWNDGGSLVNYGIAIQCGEDGVAGAGTIATGDIRWVGLVGGDGNLQSKIQYLSSGNHAEFAAPSDERMKDNIADTDANGLDVMNKIKWRKFDWNVEKALELGYSRKGHEDIWVIAQEIEEFMPSVVSEDSETGCKELSDSWMLKYACKAIQELSAKVTALENA